MSFIQNTDEYKIPAHINMDTLTPMMKQFFDVKKQYPDCLLLFRMGDFYELFFDDAMTAHKILEITLTGRDCGQEERAAMCGVPFHSADGYIAKLIEAGQKVAICEQVENPAEAKGLVKRDVIRVITAGTIMDSKVLDDKRNNYLCSICLNGKSAGLAFVDITTGELEVCGQDNLDNPQMYIINELVKYSPTEIIVNLEAYENTSMTRQIIDRYSATVQNFYNWAYEPETACASVAQQFEQSPSDLGLNPEFAGTYALGALLAYLRQTQKTDLANIKNINIQSDAQFMTIDAYSMRNLEILETMRDRKTKGTLFWAINNTQTSMGSRLLRKCIAAPLLNPAKIQKRLYAVDELVQKPIEREEIITLLKTISDIERMLGRIVYKTASARELLGLARSFESLPKIKEKVRTLGAALFGDIFKNLDTLDDIYDLIINAINEEAPFSVREGGLIKDGYHEEVDRRRKAIKDGKGWINDIVEEEKTKTGIKTMKVGYNKVFGFYVEISKSYTHMAPDYFIRKQTLANCERYITTKIKEIEELITDSENVITSLEYEIFCQIRDKVASQMERITKTGHTIAQLDFLCSNAVTADKNRFTMPIVNLSDKIIIKDGFHPVIAQTMKDEMFIPNDVELNNSDMQLSIITGPNMAGKSTYMRQTALIVLLAQMGSFVPASSAEIGIVDKIFTRVGASDDLSAGQSTFMVEMSEVAYILDNATGKSLIILDEIGRGTSTYDGLSIAWSVIEYIADVKKCGAKTLFATHYHELTELEEKIPNVKNYCIAVKKRGDEITFLRKIIRGGADESFGVEVARLAGVKKEVIKRAKEISAALEERDINRPNDAKIRSNVKADVPSESQMGFLIESEVISELKKLSLDTLTPVEALTKLYELQAKI